MMNNRVAHRNLALTAPLAVLLAACGGEDSGNSPTGNPGSNPSPTPTSASSPDLTQNKLLSDSEMRTPALSPEPVVTQAYADWALANHHPIRSITYAGDFSDLQFLGQKIGDRSIVQLGESSHGTREFNHIKTRIIKYLHQEKGFSTVAFESGYFEGQYTDRNRLNLSAADQMRFLFGVWNTEEVFELFRYAATTQNDARPLRILGLDPQISSSTYYGEIAAFIQGIPESSGISAALNQSVRDNLAGYEQFRSSFRTIPCNAPINAQCDSLMEEGELVRSRLAQNLVDLEAASQAGGDARIVYIATFAAANMISHQTASYRQQKVSDLRDLGMAEVFSLMREVSLADEKVAIWAHNRHINHEQSPTIINNSTSSFVEFPMGYHLKEKFPDELYTIGIFMLRGVTANNLGEPLQVVTPLDDSIEAIAYSTRVAALFLDISGDQPRIPGNDWIFSRTNAHIWGGTFGNYSMIPKDQFDGLIFIDTSSIPAYR